MEMVVESTVGAQVKRAAVIVGRYNPPHRGHYAVFDLVKKYIREHPELKLVGTPICVVVEGKETSKDKLKNPLKAAERISFMTGSGNADGIKFLKAASAFDAFEAVRRAGYEPIAVASGSDRAKNYLDMLNKYFKTKDDQLIKHYSIVLDRNEGSSEEQDLEELLKFAGSDMPVDMISGSLARHAVSKDEMGKFAAIVGLQRKPKLAKLMFDKIKAAMTPVEADDGTA